MLNGARIAPKLAEIGGGEVRRRCFTGYAGPGIVRGVLTLSTVVKNISGIDVPDQR